MAPPRRCSLLGWALIAASLIDVPAMFFAPPIGFSLGARHGLGLSNGMIQISTATPSWQGGGMYVITPSKFDCHRVDCFVSLANGRKMNVAATFIPVPPFILAIGGIGCLLAYRASTRRVVGRCDACDYDLTGNTSGRCPECGFVTETRPRIAM